MKTAGNEELITFERLVDAPRNIVWQAWTDPKHAAQWWGPDGCRVLAFEADLRPGGRLRIEIEHLGEITRIEGIYEDVVELERLVTFGSLARSGVKLCDSRRVVTFEEVDGKTAIVLQQTFFNLAPDADDIAAGAKAGMKQHFDRLENYLRNWFGARRAIEADS